MNNPVLSWLGIIRLGLVQTGLGAVVVLTTSTLNRVMVVELAMPAVVPRPRSSKRSVSPRMRATFVQPACGPAATRANASSVPFWVVIREGMR